MDKTTSPEPDYERSPIDFSIAGGYRYLADNGSLLVLNARFLLSLSSRLRLDMNVSNYWRDTYYKYHADVSSKTFDFSIGLQYAL